MTGPLIPQVSRGTFLFPKPTMDALAAALGGTSPEQIAQAVADYLDANPIAGVTQAQLEAALQEHVNASKPHPVYDDDMPRLDLIFQNALV